jgi:hypothetical protein
MGFGLTLPQLHVLQYTRPLELINAVKKKRGYMECTGDQVAKNI